MEFIIWLIVIVGAFFIGDRVGAAILEVRRLKKLREDRAAGVGGAR